MDLQHDEPVKSALVGGVRIRPILESVVRQIPCYHLKFSELHFIFNYRIFCSQINLSIYLSISLGIKDRIQLEKLIREEVYLLDNFANSDKTRKSRTSSCDRSHLRTVSESLKSPSYMIGFFLR